MKQIMTLFLVVTFLMGCSAQRHYFLEPDENGILRLPVGGEVVAVGEKDKSDISSPVGAKMPQIKVGETFLGAAYLKVDDGTGTFIVRSQSGLQCNGTYEYASTKLTGEGVFQCTDGDKGTLYFVFSGEAGKGFGDTKMGRQFKFTFGSPTLYR